MGTTSVSIVLVHGGFVDGSGSQGVYNLLKQDGYSVSVVQNPTISLADDVAVTKRAIAAQGGPVVLVGHSYGGTVITEAGNDPKVAALVHITAFAPDRVESVSTLIKAPPPNAPVPPILPPQDGLLFLDKTKFRLHSPPTSRRRRRSSWRTRRYLGVSLRSAGPLANRPGGQSRAGISSRPMTG
jgi:pimeloyl-ACP methyl ester carboxylesterase